jgi:REP element-mobilizing transposase RayT
VKGVSGVLASKPTQEHDAAQEDNTHKVWYKWEKIPHFDVGGIYQSITYRLDDSLPQSKLAELEETLSQLKMPTDKIEQERRKQIEALLDAGYGSCILREPENAELVINSWKHFDKTRYDLIAWVVMPTHVHVLIYVYEGTVLGDLISSWKSFTSKRFVIRPGLSYMPHWQRGYWDRFIRNERHYHNTVFYIENNPVTAGLVEKPEQWPFSSASAGSVGFQANTKPRVSQEDT